MQTQKISFCGKLDYRDDGVFKLNTKQRLTLRDAAKQLPDTVDITVKDERGDCIIVPIEAGHPEDCTVPKGSPSNAFSPHIFSNKLLQFVEKYFQDNNFFRDSE